MSLELTAGILGSSGRHWGVTGWPWDNTEKLWGGAGKARLALG